MGIYRINLAFLAIHTDSAAIIGSIYTDTCLWSSVSELVSALCLICLSTCGPSTTCVGDTTIQEQHMHSIWMNGTYTECTKHVTYVCAWVSMSSVNWCHWHCWQQRKPNYMRWGVTISVSLCKYDHQALEVLTVWQAKHIRFWTQLQL